MFGFLKAASIPEQTTKNLIGVGIVARMAADGI
jgi:hypothetical protein